MFVSVQAMYQKVHGAAEYRQVYAMPVAESTSTMSSSEL